MHLNLFKQKTISCIYIIFGAFCYVVLWVYTVRVNYILPLSEKSDLFPNLGIDAYGLGHSAMENVSELSTLTLAFKILFLHLYFYYGTKL